MTFEKKLIVRSFIPDIVAALLTFGYSITSAQISITEHSSVFIVLFTLIIVTQFVFAPVTDHIAYADISKRVSKFEHEETTETERTELLESIHHVPFTTAAMTYLYFLLGSAVIFCIYYFKFNVSLNICILLVMNLTFGSFVAAMFADSYSRKNMQYLCRKNCSERRKQ